MRKDTLQHFVCPSCESGLLLERVAENEGETLATAAGIRQGQRVAAVLRQIKWAVVARKIAGRYIGRVRGVQRVAHIAVLQEGVEIGQPARGSCKRECLRCVVGERTRLYRVEVPGTLLLLLTDRLKL